MKKESDAAQQRAAVSAPRTEGTATLTTIAALRGLAPRKPIVVMDIDGVVIDCKERIGYLLEGDVETYHKLWYTDKPILAGVSIYNLLLAQDNLRCVFVTSRDERRAREYTEEQLRYFLNVGSKKLEIIMRNAADENKPDTVYKVRALKKIGATLSEVILVFEDRDSTVRAWRDLGVTVYQTESWD